jgi:hypothetical protein
MSFEGGVTRRLGVTERLDDAESRLTTLESQQAAVLTRLDGIETEQGSILAEASGSHEQAMAARVASEKAVEEVMRFAGEYRVNERASYKRCRATHLEVDNDHHQFELRFEKLEKGENEELPPPSEVETSIDWELDEPTNHGNDDPSVAAKIWAERARAAAEEVAELRKANEEVEVLRAAKAAAEVARATAEAVLAERSRTSDRAREDAKVAGEFSVKRWQVITGMVVTLCSAGGGIWALIEAISK